MEFLKTQPERERHIKKCYLIKRIIIYETVTKNIEMLKRVEGAATYCR